MFVAFRRIFKLGWQSFTRDGGLAAATVFILVIVIALVTSLFILKEVSQFLIASIQEKVDISVYFKERALETEILNIKEEISKIPEVKEVKYISKVKALEEFVERHKDEPVLMESLEEVGNPFLASLNIKAWEASQYGMIANFLEHPIYEDLVEEVDYYQRKPVIEKIFVITSGMEKTGWMGAIILVVVAILVTFNTIRLAIYNFREEIKIQRLVGAGNWFIRGPFLVQGVISGISAALICLLIFSLISWGLSPKIEIFFPGLNIFQIFVSNFWTIVLIQLSTGILLGVISSTLAIRKYLKV